MHRNHLTRTPPLLVAAALIVGCGPESPASPEVESWLAPSLLVGAPFLTQSDLIQTDTVSGSVELPVGVTGLQGPAAAEFEGDPYDRPPSRILEAASRADFQPGFGGVYGTQKYTGNVGSVSTTAHLSYRDQHVGTASGKRQQYTPFLLDFGQVKHVWVFPKVYSDRECGLTVQGSSQHAAWWHFYQGSSVQTWGRDELFSQASPLSQGACSQNVGSFEAEDTKPGGIVCTYWITYDLDTGEVVNAELLYCSSTGGEVM